MEIEKLIEQLKRHDGVWCSIPTGERLITKVTITLKQLQAENDRFKRERDAAVEEIPKVCYYCKHRKGWKTCDKYNGNPESETCESWKWRGWEAE